MTPKPFSIAPQFTRKKQYDNNLGKLLQPFSPALARASPRCSANQSNSFLIRRKPSPSTATVKKCNETVEFTGIKRAKARASIRWQWILNFWVLLAGLKIRYGDEPRKVKFVSNIIQGGGLFARKPTKFFYLNNFGITKYYIRCRESVELELYNLHGVAFFSFSRNN